MRRTQVILTRKCPRTFVQFLDVSKHAHARMVLTAGVAVHAGFGGGVYCMDMANKLGARKLSLRQLWVIYKQTAVARGFGCSRRELAVAHVAFYSGARGALKNQDATRYASISGSRCRDGVDHRSIRG